MGLFDIFKSKRFDNVSEIIKPIDKNEIYNEIVSNYLVILGLLKIKKFNSFKFFDHEDCRRVIIDGKEYDFDEEFHHNDRKATEMLCAIDSLVADLEEKSVEDILKKVEKMINSNLLK